MCPAPALVAVAAFHGTPSKSDQSTAFLLLINDIVAVDTASHHRNHNIYLIEVTHSAREGRIDVVIVVETAGRIMAGGTRDSVSRLLYYRDLYRCPSQTMQTKTWKNDRRRNPLGHKRRP